MLDTNNRSSKVPTEYEDLFLKKFPKTKVVEVPTRAEFNLTKVRNIYKFTGLPELPLRLKRYLKANGGLNRDLSDELIGKDAPVEVFLDLNTLRNLILIDDSSDALALWTQLRKLHAKLTKFDRVRVHQ